MPTKTFSLVLIKPSHIKPSHYDDERYLIQWLRSAIPSNTLAVMNGLALDCKERRVLGDDVDLVITAYDETNTHVRVDRIAQRLAGTRGTSRIWMRRIWFGPARRFVPILAR